MGQDFPDVFLTKLRAANVIQLLEGPQQVHTVEDSLTQETLAAVQQAHDLSVQQKNDAMGSISISLDDATTSFDDSGFDEPEDTIIKEPEPVSYMVTHNQNGYSRRKASDTPDAQNDSNHPYLHRSKVFQKPLWDQGRHNEAERTHSEQFLRRENYPCNPAGYERYGKRSRTNQDERQDNGSSPQSSKNE